MAPVRLTVSNQKAFVWDMADVQTLRVEHHICGVLTGTLPQVGQQNVFLGLPLLLLPEEVVLLVKNNLAVLVDDIAAHLQPQVEQAEAYHSARLAAIEEQQLASVQFEEEKRQKMNEVYKDKIGKRRQVKDGQGQGGQKGDQVLEIFVPDIPEGETTTAPPSLATSSPSTRSLASVPYSITIHPSSIDSPWYDPTAFSFSDLESAKAAGLWNYPTTPLQAARCLVFEDLWRKGHYMGGGLRFGGDFLIYPGDPLRYHSHFTLTVTSSPVSSILPLDLVAYGRLATAVKKAHLLASWDEKEAKADYFSLEWAAFG